MAYPSSRDTFSLTRVRMDGSALKKDCGATIAEGAVDHISVPCDPADVCHAAKDIPVLVVEHVLHKGGEAVRGIAWACPPGKGDNREQRTLSPFSTLTLWYPSVFPPPLQVHLLPARSFLKHYQKKIKCQVLYEGVGGERDIFKKTKQHHSQICSFPKERATAFPSFCWYLDKVDPSILSHQNRRTFRVRMVPPSTPTGPHGRRGVVSKGNAVKDSMSHSQVLLGSKYTVRTQENPELSKESSIGALRQQADGL